MSQERKHCEDALESIRFNYSKQGIHDEAALLEDLQSFAKKRDVIRSNQLGEFLKLICKGVPQRQLCELGNLIPTLSNGVYEIKTVAKTVRQLFSKNRDAQHPNKRSRNRTLDLILPKDVNEEFDENDFMIEKNDDAFQTLNDKLGYLKCLHMEKKIDLLEINQLFPNRKIFLRELIGFLASFGINLTREEVSVLGESLSDGSPQNIVYVSDFLDFMNLNDKYFQHLYQIQRQFNRTNNQDQMPAYRSRPNQPFSNPVQSGDQYSSMQNQQRNYSTINNPVYSSDQLSDIQNQPRYSQSISNPHSPGDQLSNMQNQQRYNQPMNNQFQSGTPNNHQRHYQPTNNKFQPSGPLSNIQNQQRYYQPIFSQNQPNPHFIPNPYYVNVQPFSVQSQHNLPMVVPSSMIKNQALQKQLPISSYPINKQYAQSTPRSILSGKQNAQKVTFSDTVNVPERQDAENIQLRSSNLSTDEFEFPEQQIEFYEEFQTQFQVCEINSQEFTDPQFPPNAESINKYQTHKSLQQWRSIKWKRPLDLFNGQPYKLFSKIEQISQSRVGLGKLLSPNDIQQGILGDCYLLSAISSLAMEPHRIVDLFVTRQINPYGIYCIKICYDGLWQAVTLDDHIPCINEQPAFSKSSGNEIWVMLIEKAWAKLYGSYERIEGGQCSDAFRDLTGAPTSNIVLYEDVKVNGTNLQQINDSIFPILQRSLSEEKKFLVSASNDSNIVSQYEAEKMGLLTSHAYSIIGCTEIVHPEIGNVRLLKLRNPWGKIDWRGDWSSGSQLWTEELRTELRLNMRKDGIFYMSLDDFYRYFTMITICFYHDFYIYNSILVDEKSVNKNEIGSYLELEIQTEGNYYLSIVQRGKRNFDKELKYDYSPARILVTRVSDEKGRHNFRYKGAVQKKSREIFIEMYLTRGKYMVESIVSWLSDIASSYVFSTYGVAQTRIKRMEKTKLPPTLYDESFKHLARKSSLMKPINEDLLVSTNMDIKSGFGYYYLQNISAYPINIQLQFTESSGILLHKPHELLPLVSSLILPNSEFILIMAISYLGYSLNYSLQMNRIQ